MDDEIEYDPIINLIDSFDNRIFMKTPNPTIDSLFDDIGHSFSLLIESVINYRYNQLDLHKFENFVNWNKDDEIHSYRNILISIRRLYKEIPQYINPCQPFTTREEKIKLLKTIILNGIFNINTEDIYNYCKNQYFNKYQIVINNLGEFLTQKAFLTFIYILDIENQQENEPVQDYNNSPPYTNEERFDNQPPPYQDNFNGPPIPNQDNFNEPPMPNQDNFNGPPIPYIMQTAQGPRDFYDRVSNINNDQSEEILRYYADTDLPFFIDNNCFNDEYNFLVAAQIFLILKFQKSGFQYITFDDSEPKEENANFYWAIFSGNYTPHNVDNSTPVFEKTSQNDPLKKRHLRFLKNKEQQQQKEEELQVSEDKQQQQESSNADKKSNKKSKIKLYKKHKSSSSKSSKKKSKSTNNIKPELNVINRRDRLLKLQDLSEKALLEAINAIASGMKLHFDNFIQTVENNAIPKFVIFILKLESIENVDLNDCPEERKKQQLLKNISAVIKYLKTIEPKFSVLLFNFKNEKLIEESAIIFYTNFLNYFFIKGSRKELFNKISLLLNYKSKKKELDEYKTLTKYENYISLINLACFNFDRQKIQKREIDNLYEKAKIPKLFDKEYIELCSSLEVLPDALYYQLQFILDAFNQDKFNVVLPLIMGKSKFKRMKFPSFKEMIESAYAKKVAKDMYSPNSGNISTSNNTNYPTTFNEEKIFNVKDYNGIDYLPTFKERLSLYEIPKVSVKKTDKSEIQTDSSKDFWILPDLSYAFENGILYFKEKHDDEIHEDWEEQVRSIQESITTNETETKNEPELKGKDKKKSKDKEKSKEIEIEKKLFNDNSFIKNSGKLYIFFTYDESKKTLNFESQKFEQFCKDKLPKKDQVKTPLILLLNSFEKNEKSIVSKLINSNYPEFDQNDKNICVYGFSDRSLPLIKFYPDFEDKDNSNVNPIFLLLHVPPEKQNLEKTATVVAKIYSFLSYISDIQIVVLNKDFYIDQIEMTIGMNNIYSRKTELSFSRQKNKLINSDEEVECEDIVEIISDDDSDDENINENQNQEKIKVNMNVEDPFNTLKSKPIKISEVALSNMSKIIFLINDDSIVNYNDQIEEGFNQNFFSDELLIPFGNQAVKLHYINTENPITYKPFLTSLFDFLTKSETTKEDVIKSFSFTDLMKTRTIYFQIKMQPNWIEKLNELVVERFFKINPDSSYSHSAVAHHMRKELDYISTPYDNEFIHVCNLILSQMNDSENRFQIDCELSISSFNKFVEYCKEENNYLFLDDTRVRSVIKNHINFLHNELLDTLRYFYTAWEMNFAYEKNYDILSILIKDDLEKFDKLIQQIQQDSENSRDKNQILTITNYHIRQKEKYKELKVQIGINGDLKDEIPQDY